MRPGHFCPGNLRACRCSLSRVRRFNEAGAFLPRKLRRRRDRRSRVRRFNEAGAFLPRKRQRDRDGADLRAAASMRPGHFCPGNIDAARLNLPKVKARLQ